MVNNRLLYQEVWAQPRQAWSFCLFIREEKKKRYFGGNQVVTEFGYGFTVG